MSRDVEWTGAHIGDLIALKVQELQTRRKLRGGQPLLKIDYRDEAARAPFQFDTAAGRLHRRGCRSIPRRSRSALYGVWGIGPEEQQLACSRCKPVPKEDKTEDQSYASDLFFGFLSILDQFGGVLRERGREYRKSREGRRLGADLEGIYAGLGAREKEMLGALLSSLDGLTRTIRELDEGLNGHNGVNGRDRSNGRTGTRPKE